MTRWSSIGPGVVSPPPPSNARPADPMNTPIVPMDAAGASGASKRCRNRLTVVLLPFVPVTAITWRSVVAGNS